MASFTQTATDLSPKGYGRLRSITIRALHYGLHRQGVFY